MRIAYGYCRLSDPCARTIDQGGHRESDTMGLDAQRAAIERHYELRLKPLGFTWGGFFVDVGVTGGKKLCDRKAGDELHQRLRAGDIVLFAKLDRGFRDVLDCISTIEQWLSMEVGVHFLAEGLEASDISPYSQIMTKCVLTIMAAFAQLERARIGERTKEQKAQARLSGRPYASQPPMGWVYRGPKGARRYARCKRTQLQMTWIEKHYYAGRSIEWIVKRFKRNGVQMIRRYRNNRYKLTDWNHAAVKHALTARRYERQYGLLATQLWRGVILTPFRMLNGAHLPGSSAKRLKPLPPWPGTQRQKIPGDVGVMSLKELRATPGVQWTAMRRRKPKPTLKKAVS